jgi:TIR domain-containing protein
MNPPLHEDNISTPDLIVSTPVAVDVNVDYLQEASVPVSITNKADVPVIIDKIILQFGVNEEAASSADGRVALSCENGGLKAKGTRYWNVRFRPNLFFQEYTNCYSVEIVYRREEPNGLSAAMRVVKPAGFNFLIIKTPPAAFGHVFISYKDNEDLDLAKALFSLARRVGFSPYMAPPDLRPGLQIWEEKIIPAIKQADFAFILWTEHTPKGPGVEREINLCRKFKKEEVLLLQKTVAVPELYLSYQFKELERVRFDRQNALKTFAEVVIARRGMVEGD